MSWNPTYSIMTSKGAKVRNRAKPVEIAGYKNVRIWTVDNLTGARQLKWWSVVNDNHSSDDEAPWTGDSSISSCPF